MPYATGRVYLDADSHICETPDFYDDYYDPAIRGRAPASAISTFPPEPYDDYLRTVASSDYQAPGEADVMARKLWSAPGAFDGAARSVTLDWLGFGAQLVFDSFLRFDMTHIEARGDLDLVYGIARAHNRAVVDFCAGDPRLLPAGYVPLVDIERSVAFATEAIALGCAAIEIPSDCPADHSPSHIGLDPVYAQAAEAGVPIVFHLGNGTLLSDTYNRNGMPSEPAFHGGDGAIRSPQYATCFHSVSATVTVLAVDGVLARHPDLRIGIIEYGATWVPGWVRFLDSTMEAFRKSEARLQALDLSLSEYVQRQVRVAALCHDDVAWVTDQVGPDVLMFSSDFPHIEGGRNPLGRYERNLAQGGISAVDQDKFYAGNFADLLRRPDLLVG